MSSVVSNNATNPAPIKLSPLDWAIRILIGIYILLAPIYIFFPPIFGVNSLRFLGAFIALLALVLLPFPRARISLRIWILYFLAFLYILTLFSTDETTLAINIKNTFSPLMFFAFLVLFVRKPCENMTFWFNILIFASVISFITSLGIRTGVISVPGYRLAVAEFFSLERTAFVVDSSIGIWALIASLYTLSENQGWKRKLGYIGIVTSLGTIAFGQFRSQLICCALILLATFCFKSLKRTRFPLIAFAFATVFFVAFNFEMIMESSLAQRFRDFSISTESSALIWRTMERQVEIQLIREKPLNGHGWRVAENYQIGSYKTGKRAIFGHCLYTALPVRIGIPLAALFISSFFLLLLLALKYAIKSKSTNVRNLYFLSGLAVFSVLLVSLVQNIPHGTVSFPAFAIFVWPLLRPLPELQKIRHSENRVYRWHYMTLFNPRSRPTL